MEKLSICARKSFIDLISSRLKQGPPLSLAHSHSAAHDDDDRDLHEARLDVRRGETQCERRHHSVSILRTRLS